MADFTQKEKDFIEAQFDEILKHSAKCRKDEDSVKTIRKAFNIANEAHYGCRRKSGEPYFLHPIEVAKIVAGDIGLGMRSIACALLHDVVEDTDITVEDIENLFDPKIAQIIDGLTKIRGVLKTKTSQAENIKKILLTLSDDVRVILIKLADRLHNMRTLDAMPLDKQIRISAETRAFFVPLAHRLGFYNLKTELEDLCLKYEHPVIYNDIYKKLKGSEKKRIHYLNRFCIPLMMVFEQNEIKYNITSRSKSISSIWHKIQTKNVSFENVYDVFAVRIILVDVPREEEKAMCWRVYSYITDTYTPNPKRLRDWVSTPKENGYEGLHTTVMGPDGNWVEIQIRTERMNEIAERGYAAHWKYKDVEGFDKTELEQWLQKLRTTLENPNNDALAFLDDFKLNLYTTEIFAFTPQGDLKRLPSKANVLDFAFEIHTQIGLHAIGAKVNRHKTVPLDYEVQNGDQIEILTSEKQKPQKEWLSFITTAKAKNSLQQIFKNERKKNILRGQNRLQEALRAHKLKENKSLLDKLIMGYGVMSINDLYVGIGDNSIDLSDIESVATQKRKNKAVRFWKLQLRKAKDEHTQPREHKDVKIVHDNTSYIIAECCRPIPGDTIVGFETPNGYAIHKSICPYAIELQTKYIAHKIKWINKKEQAFLVSIKIEGNDRIGLLNDITKITSYQHNINIRTVHIETTEKMFEGNLDLYIHDLQHLNNLMLNLQKIKGVKKIFRIDKI
ncbi:MAG: RelA/SpoT family protein [Bacteroidales bacterium]|jgi:guanosine-3',5'-bis(diphosphate) 3'-pyrophosphohydrolase|nr:RelA/SpoT family protein [Bacteroidales bacterium]